jgi:hypothetical protein
MHTSAYIFTPNAPCFEAMLVQPLMESDVYSLVVLYGLPFQALF